MDEVVSKTLKATVSGALFLAGCGLMNISFYISLVLSAIVVVLYVSGVFTTLVKMLTIITLSWGIAAHWAGAPTPLDAYHGAIQQLPWSTNQTAAVPADRIDASLAGQLEQLSTACAKQLLTPEECKLTRAKLLEKLTTN